MFIQDFLMGLLVGMIFVGLIGFFIVTSSIDYVRNRATEVVQSSIERVKQIFKALETDYRQVFYDGFRPFGSYFAKDGSNQRQTHAFFLRLIMATTNWALNHPLDFPDDIKIVEEIDKYALLVKMKDNYFLIFRGSLYSEDFDKDLEASQVVPNGYPEGAMVHSGMWDIFKRIEPKIRTLYRTYKPEKIYLAGNSLGAVLALFSAAYFPPGQSELYLYGIPRCGNYEFIKHIENRYNINIWNNRTDIVPTMPTTVYGSIFGNSAYYYCDFSRVGYINVQRGNMMHNHSLDTYLLGFDPVAPECKEVKPIWNEVNGV